MSEEAFRKANTARHTKDDVEEEEEEEEKKSIFA